MVFLISTFDKKSMKNAIEHMINNDLRFIQKTLLKYVTINLIIKKIFKY